MQFPQHALGKVAASLSACSPGFSPPRFGAFFVFVPISPLHIRPRILRAPAAAEWTATVQFPGGQGTHLLPFALGKPSLATVECGSSKSDSQRILAQKKCKHTEQTNKQKKNKRKCKSMHAHTYKCYLASSRKMPLHGYHKHLKNVYGGEQCTLMSLE